jgi:hypothetical protein
VPPFGHDLGVLRVCIARPAGCGATPVSCVWKSPQSCGTPMLLLAPGSSARLRTSLDSLVKLTYSVLSVEALVPGVLTVDGVGRITTSGTCRPLPITTALARWRSSCHA